MNKRPLNDAAFSIQGVNPGLNTREELTTNSSQQTAGRIICERQQLLACPYLQNNEQIKLLNLQKNCIVKITNLDHLTSLVVLDLCENEIDCIQGLDNLSLLRILRLANNKIKQIKNLDSLTQLDVLDLNGNQISRIENCKHLIRLRVLNLANNRIEKCENLRHLQNLVELNLQGNLITSVSDLEKLPIQRLFLNFNKIRKYEDMRCISKLTTLKLLSLEGNPLPFPSSYEQIILSQTDPSSPMKQDSRQPMNIDNRINRIMRLQQNNLNPETTNKYRDRRALDVISNQQDSMSERSDTDIDSGRNIPPPILNRTSSVTQQKPAIKLIQEMSSPIPPPVETKLNSIFNETKLNPIINERSILAKSLVQSAIDDAFRKESTILQLERYWPLLLTQFLTDKNELE
ncbi:unnamed protein product [Adineta steineri]|uniref:Uncharacterized protein n=1 Tax=Adineta steineri TaxID=433720 RepID=A0A815UD00_9BILA|nr:unnamed protein product [Adineta steineri]CAF1649232.1 unnamed protein product [Adineta steineri]